MKRLHFIILFTFSIGIAIAHDNQDPRDMVRIGLNGAFFGSGDVLGISTSMEYVRHTGHQAPCLSGAKSGGTGGGADRR